MSPSTSPRRRAVLVVHGGAGTIERSRMTPEREAAYRAALTAALRAGHAVLERGGSSLDAVEATLVVLEDSPLFNAGKGAVFTHEGTVELDASIMDGATKEAGGVAAVGHVKNPVRAARRVLERSPHVLLVGEGAEAFLREEGLEFVPNEFFHTDWRREQLQRLLEAEGDETTALDVDLPDGKFGTVGAVAVDARGHLAAATSTGGMTNKRFGRVGDSPIIGAGTWAEDSTCAVSATGHGEYFIRAGIAQDVASRMKYLGVGVEQAARDAIHGSLEALGGRGGVIALDARGHFATPFNTTGMYRGWIDAQGRSTVQIYADEPDE